MTVNEWYKAEQLGETCWLCVVWDPLDPKHELVPIQNPAKKLDHSKKEQVSTTRTFVIPAQAIESAADGTNQETRLLRGDDS